MRMLLVVSAASLLGAAFPAFADELTPGTYHCVATPDDPAMTGDIVIAGNSFSSGGSGTYDYDSGSGQITWHGTPEAAVMDAENLIRSSNATGRPGGDQQIYFFSHWDRLDADMVVACSR